ncbi:MAG: hypothetical protein M1820_003801 [Bogoriella megaspora]|nr:MAG: hypothetical protein M1820_003801 [Bogoriella megaspora]
MTLHLGAAVTHLGEARDPIGDLAIHRGDQPGMEAAVERKKRAVRVLGGENAAAKTGNVVHRKRLAVSGHKGSTTSSTTSSATMTVKSGFNTTITYSGSTTTATETISLPFSAPNSTSYTLSTSLSSFSAPYPTVTPSTSSVAGTQLSTSEGSGSLSTTLSTGPGSGSSAFPSGSPNGSPSEGSSTSSVGSGFPPSGPGSFSGSRPGSPAAGTQASTSSSSVPAASLPSAHSESSIATTESSTSSSAGIPTASHPGTYSASAGLATTSVASISSTSSVKGGPGGSAPGSSSSSAGASTTTSKTSIGSGSGVSSASSSAETLLSSTSSSTVSSSTHSSKDSSSIPTTTLSIPSGGAPGFPPSPSSYASVPPYSYSNSSTARGSSITKRPSGVGSTSVPSTSSAITAPVTSTTSVSLPSSLPITNSPSVTLNTSGLPSISTSISVSANLTISAMLPNVTSPINTSLPTNTSTSTACTTKPTPSCIPCEGAPDPSAPWCGYDINTDYYKYVPKTCKTVEYDLVVTESTASPDGIERYALLINGQFPGPLIEANWGDTIVVHLTNNIPADLNNGTSLHFHGIRQNYTNEMDGVPAITQCPLAPGESMTYTFEATQYGTSWYHSHFQIQAWEGVFGPMIIHGPKSADYDIDVGPIILQDWSHQTVDEMYDGAQDGVTGGPRVLDTGLINGKNVWGADNATNQTGSRFELDFVPRKKHLLHIVNTAIQSTFKFYIDGHKFQVISSDFVPIKPYYTNVLNINIGQRYEIIVEADQPVGDYWMRSDNMDVCAVLTQATNIKGMVHYLGGPMAKPTSTAYNYTKDCVDEPAASLVPVVPYTVGAEDQEYDETVVVSAANSLNLYRWYLTGTDNPPNGTTFQSEWSDPTLFEVYHNNSIPPYSGGLALKVPKLQEWVYFVIESPIPLAHPIHLHGHDFFVLGSGNGTYDSGSSTALNLNNPPRRDVALLPAAGYLVLAFQSDNPGIWLMHCHIGWHTSMGFAMQIIEAQDLIKPTVTDSCLLDDTCKSWRKYATGNDIKVTDSGV